MNTGQTLLTFGALFVLTIAIFNNNRHLAHNDISLAQNRYKLEALSLISSHLEQALGYYFDEASTDTVSEKRLNDFTLPNDLGFENNDNNVIDDFDDFHNYTIIDTGRSGIPYRISFHVEYVELQNGVLVPSNSRQYYKRITIRATDNYADPLIYHYSGNQKIKDTLKVSFVNSYWFYN